MSNNLKAFIVAFFTGILVLFAAQEALSDELENCQNFADNFVGPVTDARDAGTPPEVIFQQLVMVGFNPEGAYNLVQTVYLLHKDSSKEEVLASFMNWCVGEGV